MHEVISQDVWVDSKRRPGLPKSLTLFDAMARTDRSSARNAEGSFRFLNRVAGLYWGRVRKLMETWFASYPSASKRERESKADLRERFRSRDDRSHMGAFWELYQAEALRRSGYRITPHPAMPGSTKSPDFLAEGPSGSFYIEMTIASTSDAKRAAAKRLGAIKDAINAIPSPDFFVGMEVDAYGSEAPDTKRLRRELSDWLAGLDPDQLIALGSLEDVRKRHVHEWRERGWVARFWPMPKKAGHRRVRDHTIGIGPISTGFVDTTGPLREAIDQKRPTRYGPLDRPYVIAVLLESPFLDKEDMLNALFGTVAVQVDVNASSGGLGDHRWVRKRDGAWTSGSGPRNTRVSAVITAINLGPAVVATVAPRLWLNPWAKPPLVADLPWHRTVIDLANGEPVDEPARESSQEFFGLPPAWPGPGRPFPR